MFTQYRLPKILLGETQSQKTDFEYIFYIQLCNMAKRPTSLPKPQAKIFAPHDSYAKTGEAIAIVNRHTALVCDVDDGNLSAADIQHRLKSLGIGAHLIYATHSWRPTRRRWRVVVPLVDPIRLIRWVALQGLLADELGGDRCAEKPTQISYCPNRGPNGYSHLETTGVYLDGSDTKHPFLAKAWARVKQLEIEKAKAKAKELAEAGGKAPKPSAACRETAGQLQPIAEFNAANPLDQLLPSLGYSRQGKKWLHPNSTSGLPGIFVRHDRYHSAHGCDRLADGSWHSAFDVWCDHNYSGDYHAAIRAAADETMVGGQSVTSHNRQVFRDSK
jgi:hypothetical protein